MLLHALFQTNKLPLSLLLQWDWIELPRHARIIKSDTCSCGEENYLQKPSADARSPSHLKSKSLGAKSRRRTLTEPALHCPTQPCCSPRVATPPRCGQGDGPADCKRGWQDAAPACAAAPLFTRSGTRGEAESGGRPWEMWLHQSLSHGEGSRRGGSAPRTAALSVSLHPCWPLAPCEPQRSRAAELFFGLAVVKAAWGCKLLSLGATRCM